MEKRLLILIIIFIIVSILFSVSLVLQIYNHFKFKKRNNEKTKMCFECGYHFDSNDQNNLEFIYCPFCGKKLFGFDDESLNRFDKEYNEENL